MMANRKSPPLAEHLTTKRPALATLTSHQVDYLQPQAKQACRGPFRNVSVQGKGITTMVTDSVFPDFARVDQQYDTAVAFGKTASITTTTTKLFAGSPMLISSTQGRSSNHETTQENGSRSVLVCADYCHDVIRVLKERELKLRPRPLYMSEQTDINPSMRTILVDWLVEVTEEFRLCTETLHLAINYIDRFLSIMHVQRNKLQLVGTSSMLLACKLEEIHPPEVSMFVEITDNTYTSEQVKTMELFILRHLNYELSAPTSNSFLLSFALVCDSPDHLVHLGLYFCELALLNSDPFLTFIPSRIAAASLCLARHTLDLQAWPKELKTATGYTLSDLLPVISPLYTSFVENSKSDCQQGAVYRRYSRNIHSGVANTMPIGIPTQSFETVC